MDGDVRAVSYGIMILGGLLTLIGVVRMCFLARTPTKEKSRD